MQPANNFTSGRGTIPQLSQQKTVQAFGVGSTVKPANASKSAVNTGVARQRNSVAMSNSYQTPDFTISVSNENQQNNQISAIGHNYRTSSVPQAPQMDLAKTFTEPPSTAGFKELTSTQVAMANDQFKMDSGPNPYSYNNEAAQTTAGQYMAAGAGSSSRQFGSSMQYGFRAGINQSAQRGSSLVMQASNDVTAETSSDKDENLLNKPMTQEEKNNALFNPVYSYFVLFVVLAARIMVQWQRKGLNYAYGYTGLGEMRNNPIYEIATAYPQLKNWYGLLVGLIYTVPYSFFGLIAGKISDNVNRKLYLGLVLILAGATCGVTGFFDSFFLLGAMRVLHGMLNSSSNPLSFSIISDYFPPDKRATANSIIQAGNYIGVAVSSFSILLITSFGWRAQYGIMAGLGTLFGLATMLTVKEPERGRFLDEATKKKEAEKKAQKEAEAATQGNPLAAFIKNIGVVFTLPTAKNVLIASSLRNFGGMIVSSFLPVFFGRNFPAFKAEYAMLNALALSGCGLTASIGGGIIADKFEKKSYWTKAILCIQGCAISFPLIALGTLTTGNFYLSVLCYALKVLFSGTYSGPAITMIQNTSPQEQQGNVVSVYFFCITLAQTVSPVIFGYIANAMGALANPALYGPLITSFVGLSYLGSIPFWWKAGANYKKHMEAKDAENARLGAA